MRVPLPTETDHGEGEAAGLPIRILTHNIRYDAQSRFPHERPWAERRSGMISELRYHTRHCHASIICLQEVLHKQLVNILAGLNSKSSTKGPEKEDEWAYVGVARDDGKQAGEYSPIIYRVGAWDLQHEFTMWLSPTPNIPGSKGWDAGCVRILTVAVLISKATGQVVVAMNTHLDDQGKVSRRESAKLIVQELVTLGRRFKYDGAFLAGDLNSKVDGEAYKILNRPDSGFVDLRPTMHGMKGDIYGDENTFTGYVLITPFFFVFLALWGLWPMG